jgi:hypothetical protein
MNRLATLSASLDQQFRQAAPERRMAAVLQVCAQAQAEIGVLDPALAAALAAVQAGAAADRAALAALRDRLDDAYFDAQEAREAGAAAPDELPLFSQARLAAALDLTPEIAAPDRAADCLYEALMALQDNQVTVRTLELTLS